MSWVAVGTVSPGFSWTEFGDPLLTDTLIRVRSHFDQQVFGSALLRMNFIDGFYGAKRFGASTDWKLLKFTIPSELFNDGTVSFYLAARLGYYTRPHENDNWTIEVQQFV